MDHKFDIETERQAVKTVYFDREGLAEETRIGDIGIEPATRAVIESLPLVDVSGDILTAFDASPEYREVTAQLATLSKHKHTKRQRLERRRASLSRQIMTSVLQEMMVVPEIVAVETEQL